MKDRFPDSNPSEKPSDNESQYSTERTKRGLLFAGKQNIVLPPLPRQYCPPAAQPRPSIDPSEQSVQE